MRWFYVTLGLLASSVCLVGWIYLRDRHTSSYQPSGLTERQLAHADASTTLAVLNKANCRSDCAIELLGHTGPHRWLVRLTLKGRPKCLQIDLDTFTFSQQHGLVGVQPSRCAFHPTDSSQGRTSVAGATSVARFGI
jgi:hypothetical protein